MLSPLVRAVPTRHDGMRLSPWLLFGSVAAALFLLMAGCGKQNEYQEPPPLAVPTCQPRQGYAVAYIEQTGTAQAFERVEVRSRVSGALVERRFHDGEQVRKGQVLFVIDEMPFKVALQQATARLSEAEASLRQSQLSKARESSRAKVKLSEADLALAETQLQRSRSLVDRSALPQQDLDRSLAEHAKAKATVDSNQAELQQAEADYDSLQLRAEAMRNVALAAVRNAELELGYCRILSPIDGRIDARAYDVGNYIRAESSNALATVVQLNPIYVNITPSATDLIRIRTANRRASGPIAMYMGFDAMEDFSFAGEVDYIAPTVDDSTGTVRVRGIFQNPEDTVIPGLLLRVRIPAEASEDAILVPVRSIGFDQAGAFVYVVAEGNKIERRSVIPGTTMGNDRAVTGKLEVTDQVVLDGLLRVRPGIVVAPTLALDK